MLAFFGVKATIIYAVFTFAFAVIMGMVLDKAGFEKYVKKVSVKGGHQDGVCWENLHGTFWQKQWQAMKLSLKDAFGLFKGVVLESVHSSMNLFLLICWLTLLEQIVCGQFHWQRLSVSQCISEPRR